MKGKNAAPDVVRIQDALNAIPVHEGTPQRLLSLDGRAGPKTCDAIQRFQLKHFGWKLADGRVDPGGKTDQRIASLLNLYGSAQWNIRRLESAVPAAGSVARTANSRDRFFAIFDPTGMRRVLYWFVPPGDAEPPAPQELPPLRERPELKPFLTAVACGPYSFVGDATYSEFSPTANTTAITITLNPRAAHVSAGPLVLQIHHEWIEPTTTPGVPVNLVGALAYVQDQSHGPGVRKLGRKG